MPGWHAKTKDLVEAGTLVVAGIAPEQHGDRMQLFLQWKEMEHMDVLLDSYNLYGLTAVPYTYLIDEAGIVRARNPKQEDLKKFLAAPPIDISTAPKAYREPFHDWAVEADLSSNERTREVTPAEVDFKLGVAHRKVYDLGPEAGDPRHLERAIYYWRRALERNPGNYIWRRRLQQYGPRLDKPYPFYDWVATARADLRKRGVDPHPLRAEPSGAEIAKPAKSATAHTFVDPDPERHLPEDLTKVVQCRVLVVPHTKKPAHAMRVQLTLTPSSLHMAKWNDVPEAPTIQMIPQAGWQASPPEIILHPDAKESPEVLAGAARQIEFEVSRIDPAGDNHSPFACTLYYSICHGESRLCQLLRRDLLVEHKLIEILKPQKGLSPEGSELDRE